MKPKYIKPAYEHNKIGTFLFNLSAVWTEFLVKHRALYYILALTWGILMTLLGAIITVIILLTIYFLDDIIVEHYNWVYYFRLGQTYWGGCEMGLMFLRDHKSTDSYINAHEFGHTFQECLFGPIYIFLVAIPSACRYWYQEIRSLQKKQNKPYNSIWFEDSATQCGKYANEYLNKETVSQSTL